FALLLGTAPAPAAYLHGLPVGSALTGAKADERQVLLDIVADPALIAGRDGQIIIADRNYYGNGFETVLADGHICLLRPARQGEPHRPGSQSSTTAPGHRIGQRHVQRPARPRTPRRPHPRGRHRAGPAAHPRP